MSSGNQQAGLFPIPGGSKHCCGIVGWESSSRQIDSTCVWSLAHTCSGSRIMKLYQEDKSASTPDSPLSAWLGSCSLHCGNLYTSLLSVISSDISGVLS